MTWLNEYEWTSPMQTSVSAWERYLALYYPCPHPLDIDEIWRRFQNGERERDPRLPVPLRPDVLRMLRAKPDDAGTGVNP